MLRFYLEAIAVAHQNQVALTVGGRLTGYDIHVSMPVPPRHARYFGLSPARLHFDERAVPGVRVVMDSELLDAPLPMASARGWHIEDRLDAQRARTPPPEGKGGEFVTMMLRETQGVQLTLEEIAQRLEVSSRTVARALQKEASEFRALSQRVMFEQACERMGAEGATESRVADELGFKDVSTFSRSFAAWPAWRHRNTSTAGLDRARAIPDSVRSPNVICLPGAPTRGDR